MTAHEVRLFIRTDQRRQLRIRLSRAIPSIGNGLASVTKPSVAGCWCTWICRDVRLRQNRKFYRGRLLTRGGRCTALTDPRYCPCYWRKRPRTMLGSAKIRQLDLLFDQRSLVIRETFIAPRFANVALLCSAPW